MVEGPGATNNGIKAKKLIGHQVQLIQYNSELSATTGQSEYAADSSLSSASSWWEGRYLSDVITIGKEVFLIFTCLEDDTNDDNGDLSLRLHFGMNGTLHLRKISSKMRKKADQRTLEIIFGLNLTDEDNQIMETFQATTKGPIPARIPRERFRKLHQCDACSTSFQPEAVLSKLLERRHTNPQLLISDALLNQDLFPGVGNIIKVEGLHNACIHPKSPLSVLSNECLLRSITECRAYAWSWFKNGRAPMKKVYNKVECFTCKSTSIAMQRVGSFPRTTFWCTKCQPLLSETNVTESSSARNTTTSSSSSSIEQGQAMSSITSRQRVCPHHGPNFLVLRRTRNAKNTNRIFYTCKAKNCNYFNWADSHFPKCHCNKKAIIRISKTESTGGRWFFSCGARENSAGRVTKYGGRGGNGCSFFEWCKKEDLEKLGSALTPLL